MYLVVFNHANLFFTQHTSTLEGYIASDFEGKTASQMT
jgi:hypothetical protein